ncbi:hypothetical protein AVEN_30726-1 [Araneus ventricosus]|uniref:Uncharacterized protein n=1 Tax=Araneus ventricosus TaxID=182803 RepID=A0A4Y2XAU4_ARAVE|nr:hypothetical protein AVEN_30726-1 [Araneus ventricosus]
MQIIVSRIDDETRVSCLSTTTGPRIEVLMPIYKHEDSPRFVYRGCFGLPDANLKERMLGTFDLSTRRHRVTSAGDFLPHCSTSMDSSRRFTVMAGSITSSYTTHVRVCKPGLSSANSEITNHHCACLIDVNMFIASLA